MTWQAKGDPNYGAQRAHVDWLSDDDMLPAIVPSAKIYMFTWNSRYYEDAPVSRIRGVANILLSSLQTKRDRVRSMYL